MVDDDRKSKPKSRRVARGKKQPVKCTLDMPLDIINEVNICSFVCTNHVLKDELQIFSHLEPLDLLHLARTTKLFRNYLMSRRSALLWKTAQRNLDCLSDCPPYLSEPAYAELMFGLQCHASIYDASCECAA